MRRTSTIIFLAIDDLIPVAGEPAAGLGEFSAKLDHAGIPAVWLTERARLQLDAARRKLGHSHPFIGEDGCGIYLPQDYFHLRPNTGSALERKHETVRLGRFTCIPVAELQPAAAEALESLSRETGVPVVPLRSLPPRELAQNLGLPLREAEFARQRDFDEFFFFAGTSELGIARFEAAARNRNVQLRKREALLSLAVGASSAKCIQALSRLYDRALQGHALTVGVSTVEPAKGIRSVCDHFIVLTREGEGAEAGAPGRSFRSIPLRARDLWERLLDKLMRRELEF